MGPARLAALLGRWGPAEAWARVIGRRATADPGVARACRPDTPASVGGAWAEAARRTQVAEAWAAHRRAGVEVVLGADPGYPSALATDQEPPAVLFVRGDPGALARRRVAIVGTRQCTAYGIDVARELGCDLASAGVAVVSGLALGIDGAAHAGALAAGGAPPVGVVGSGIDVVYPRRHARLWHEVGASGLLISEAPLGTRPEPWRFPVRNRVIAALAEVVVVVESHAKGGSLHTVEAAMARDRQVMAVPGSVRSPASAFTNALLADGCAPARDATDVLVALGLAHGAAAEPASDPRCPPHAESQRVLDAIGWEPASLDDVVARSGLGPGPVGLALAQLEGDGWVVSRTGWWERISPPSGGRR
jgi:DNA processing protein